MSEVVAEPVLDYRGKERVQTEFHDESLTIQSDAPKADIQKILKQYKQVGIVDHLNYAEATFRDISEFEDFADAMRHAREAESEFLKLPSKVREIFNHDVAEWLDAAHDPEKRDALVAAGIIDPPPEVEEGSGSGSGAAPPGPPEEGPPAEPAGGGATE